MTVHAASETSPKSEADDPRGGEGLLQYSVTCQFAFLIALLIASGLDKQFGPLRD